MMLSVMYHRLFARMLVCCLCIYVCVYVVCMCVCVCVCVWCRYKIGRQSQSATNYSPFSSNPNDPTIPKTTLITTRPVVHFLFIYLCQKTQYQVFYYFLSPNTQRKCRSLRRPIHCLVTVTQLSLTMSLALTRLLTKRGANALRVCSATLRHQRTFALQAVVARHHSSSQQMNLYVPITTTTSLKVHAHEPVPLHDRVPLHCHVDVSPLPTGQVQEDTQQWQRPLEAKINTRKPKRANKGSRPCSRYGRRKRVRDMRRGIRKSPNQ